MSDVLFTSDRQLTRRTNRALRLKEWIEQRWRFALGTVVLSTLLGGMLRAQIIPFHEAAIMVYWPIGTILALFLAMGPVATEKTGRTWEFLLAQPVPEGRILLAKWRTGLYELIAMNCIAGAVGAIALWSRGFYGIATVWEIERDLRQSDMFRWIDIATQHPLLWLCLLVLVATVTMACWYAFLFVMLTRAKNEFAAALAGVLLTIAAHIWLLQVLGPYQLIRWSNASSDWSILRVIAGLCPFAEFMVLVAPGYLNWLALMVPLHMALWIGVPVLVMARRR